MCIIHNIWRWGIVYLLFITVHSVLQTTILLSTYIDICNDCQKSFFHLLISFVLGYNPYILFMFMVIGIFQNVTILENTEIRTG